MRSMLGMMVAALVLTMGAPGAAFGQSCEGACGGSVNGPGGSCQCSAYCGDFDDCCSDFEEHCPLTAAVGETCPVSGVAGLACFGLGHVASCAENPDPSFCTFGYLDAVGFCAENPEVCAEGYLGVVESCAENPVGCAGPIGLVEYCAENPEVCAGFYVGLVEYCAENPEACVGL